MRFSVPIVGIVIVLLMVGITAWDVVLFTDGIDGNTLSRVLKRTSREWVVLAYLWGVLGAHLFAGHYQAVTTPLGDLWITLGSVGAVLVLDLLLFRRSPAPAVYITFLAAGVAVGHFFWSQG